MLLEKKPFPWSFSENVKQKKSFAATVLWSLKGVWWESNPWPPEPQSGALPTELQTPYIAVERVEMNRQVPKPFLLSLYHRAIFCSGGRTRTYEVNRQWIYSPPSLPLEHSRIFFCGASWSRTMFSGFSVLRIHHVCQSSNFVTRMGVEPITWCFVDNRSDPIELPRHLRKQKDSNLRNLVVRHVSTVLV